MFNKKLEINLYILKLIIILNNNYCLETSKNCILIINFLYFEPYNNNIEIKRIILAIYLLLCG